jgi:hypothetical protein
LVLLKLILCKVRFILTWYINDNHVIKLAIRRKEVVNKVIVDELWFDYGMIPMKCNK